MRKIQLVRTGCMWNNDSLIYKVFFIILSLLFLFPATGVSKEAEDIFPNMEGWELSIGDKVYTPDNLWDIINGAADAYQSYDFQRLYTAEYFDDQERSIRVYIFEHSNPTNTFGIYTQERSEDYEFNDTGAQGFNSGDAYYFITGTYYVQLSAYNEGLDEQMEQLAQLIDKKLNQANQLPYELGLFPQKGKVPFSEKYIANDFLGYGFLHSAFVASYKQGGDSFQIFIINPEDEEETESIMVKYLDFVEFPEDKRNSDKYSIEDPYNGSVLLFRKGKYLCGIMGTDDNTKNEYLGLLKERLRF